MPGIEVFPGPFVSQSVPLDVRSDKTGGKEEGERIAQFAASSTHTTTTYMVRIENLILSN